MPFRKQKCQILETENFIFRGSFQFSIIKIKKKISPPRNLKFNNLGIFQSLKLRKFNGKKILPIYIKLSLPNTLGCYGLVGKLSLTCCV